MNDDTESPLDNLIAGRGKLKNKRGLRMISPYVDEHNALIGCVTCGKTRGYIARIGGDLWYEEEHWVQPLIAPSYTIQIWWHAKREGQVKVMKAIVEAVKSSARLRRIIKANTKKQHKIIAQIDKTWNVILENE